ncbi:hypothetical protein NBRC110019_31480 [Neptunitalea chrysea]|uniref:Uncharacterized protein n=1 Tax=Neptunitalea chrysea TaxID=1647581 RepID=A0A9W6B8P4_9FLAO|nr:hypothetical protein [Neptunitalea chrysea]GLB54107.1 hypothetical protein NBRC110019_31480 [Neptunitalea chrysea]
MNIKSWPYYYGIILLLFITSCQPDDTFIQAETNTINEIGYNFKRKTFNELSQETKFKPVLDAMFNKKNLFLKENGKTIMEHEYNFTIDSTLIKEFSSDSYTSYTFLIRRDTIQPSTFENLVVVLDSINSPKAYIIKYILNAPPLYVPADNAYSLDATKELTPITYNTNTYSSKFTLVQSDGCTIATLMCPFGLDHEAGQACVDAKRGDLYLSYDSSNCYDTGSFGGSGFGDSGDSGSSDSGDSGSGDSSTGGGGSDDGSDDSSTDVGCRGCGDDDDVPIITNPVLEEEIEDEEPDPIITKLENLLNIDIIRNRIDYMVSKIDSTQTELGSEFRLELGGTYSEYVVPDNDLDFDTTKFPDAQSNSRIKLHLHQRTPIINQPGDTTRLAPIPSFEDIAGFCKFSSQLENLNANGEDAVSILVSRRGLYALTIEDSQKAIQFYHDLLNVTITIDDDNVPLITYLKDTYREMVLDKTRTSCPGTCQDDIEDALFELFFTEFLKKLDCGLNLHRAFLIDGSYIWTKLN